jgi:hypothetical protein
MHAALSEVAGTSEDCEHVCLLMISIAPPACFIPLCWQTGVSGQLHSPKIGIAPQHNNRNKSMLA